MIDTLSLFCRMEFVSRSTVRIVSVNRDGGGGIFHTITLELICSALSVARTGDQQRGGRSKECRPFVN